MKLAGKYKSVLRSSLHTDLASEVFIYILLAATLMLIINPHNLNYYPLEMDEIWNYQYARRILYGFIPYKDFMMLPIPFSAQFNGWVLSFLGDKLIVMRWIASAIAVLNGIVAFHILRLSDKGHWIALLYTVLFLCPFILYPKNNYSWYAVLFLSVALLMEIHKVTKPNDFIYEILIGMSLGMIIITKQNIGMAGLVGSIVFLIYYSNNQGIIYFFRCLSFKILACLSIVGIEIIYLSQKMGFSFFLQNMYDNLTKFTGYASIPYWELFSNDLAIVLLALFIPGAILFSFVKGLFSSNDTKKNIIIVTSVYALANFAMIIPLADWLHLLFGMPISVLAIATTSTNAVDQRRKQKLITVVFLILVIILTIIYPTLSEPIRETGPEIKHYESVNLPLETESKIIELNKLITNEENRGQTVYFLNYQATLFLIPLDKFCYRYDDIIGENSLGERELVEKLSTSSNNTVIIRCQNREKNRQETDRLEKLVRETMTYKQSLHGFDVYAQ